MSHFFIFANWPFLTISNSKMYRTLLLPILSSSSCIVCAPIVKRSSDRLTLCQHRHTLSALNFLFCLVHKVRIIFKRYLVVVCRTYCQYKSCSFSHIHSLWIEKECVNTYCVLRFAVELMELHTVYLISCARVLFIYVQVVLTKSTFI